MSNLIDRLRKLGNTMSGSSGGYLCCECADELDRLTRERDEFRERANASSDVIKLLRTAIADDEKNIASLTRERDQARKPMRWTKEPPTKPGMWWHRYLFGNEVDRKPNVWLIRDYAGDIAYQNSRLDEDPELPEEWSDRPIQEPEE